MSDGDDIGRECEAAGGDAMLWNCRSSERLAGAGLARILDCTPSS